MTKFEDYETEQYYYEKMRRLGIQHINWGFKDTVLTKERIDETFDSIENATSKITRVPIDEMHIC